MAKRRKRKVGVPGLGAQYVPGLKQPRAKAAKDQSVNVGIALEKDTAGSVLPAPTQEAHEAPEGNYAAQTVPGLKQQGGDVNIEPPAAQLELGGHAPTARVSYTFTAGPRIRLSDPSAEKAKAQLDISRQKLEQLQATLEKFHGDDALGNRNTQVVPFSEDELQTLRKVVAAAIPLHETPVVSKLIIDALDSIKEYLAKARKVLDEATKTSRSLRGLAVEVGATYLAIKELIDIFTSLLGS